MDRKEAMQAMLDGKTVRPVGRYARCYYDPEGEVPFYIVNHDGLPEKIHESWGNEEWELVPESTVRTITASELFEFGATHIRNGSIILPLPSINIDDNTIWINSEKCYVSIDRFIAICRNSNGHVDPEWTDNREDWQDFMITEKEV